MKDFIFLKGNNGGKYVDEYINNSKTVRVSAKPLTEIKDIHWISNSNSYIKYTIFFKAIMGGYDGYMLKDEISGTYFNIIRFDSYGFKFSTPQSGRIAGKELYVKVDPKQYNNPKFGTKENPIVVFSYRWVNEKFMTDITTDSIGADGYYVNKRVPLAPSKEEYRYNVEQYLTYLMPEDEFEKRFEPTSAVIKYVIWGLVIVLALGGTGYILYKRSVNTQKIKEAQIADENERNRTVSLKN